VAIGFDEGRIWPLVHIAQRRHLKAPLVRGDERRPARIDAGGLAEQLVGAEKAVARARSGETESSLNMIRALGRGIRTRRA